jgi:CBS-domain-containing membrane protein
MQETLSELTVADVMLPRPKTLSSAATVGEVRAMLGNASVQMVLLADGSRFRGAITAIPDDAPDEQDALRFAEQRPQSLRAGEPAQTAFDVTAKNPHRRVVVLGDEDELVGLVCLNEARTNFCGGTHREPS